MSIAEQITDIGISGNTFYIYTDDNCIRLYPHHAIRVSSPNTTYPAFVDTLVNDQPEAKRIVGECMEVMCKLLRELEESSE